MSALCQTRTYARQQKYRLIDHFVGSREKGLLPLKADIDGYGRNVRFVPKRTFDLSSLVNLSVDLIVQSDAPRRD